MRVIKYQNKRNNHKLQQAQRNWYLSFWPGVFPNILIQNQVIKKITYSQFGLTCC